MNNIQHGVESDFIGYLRIISRRRRTFILVSAFVFSIMAAYAFLTPPVYQATALVSVDKVGSDISAPSENRDSDEGYFETQFKLITSETQLRRVYDDLKLGGIEEFKEGLKPLREAVTVLPLPRTRLASVTVESKDARLSASIAGSLAQAFVRKNLDNQLFMSKTVLGALQARSRDGDARLLVEALPAVVNNRMIQDVKTQIFNTESQLADMRTRFTANYPAVMALQSRLDSMRKVRDR